MLESSVESLSNVLVASLSNEYPTYLSEIKRVFFCFEHFADVSWYDSWLGYLAGPTLTQLV